MEQVEQVERVVVHLESVTDPQPETTQTATGMHAPSILGKEDRTPSSVNATLCQREAV